MVEGRVSRPGLGRLLDGASHGPEPLTPGAGMNADLTVHTWRASEYRYLVTPPDPEVYEEIRRLVPADRLDYDPLRKAWRIRGVYWLSLKRALEDLGYGQVREHQSRASYEQSNPDVAGAELAVQSHEAFETLFLLPGAPDSVVEAAYRALAKIYRPDMGGDPKRMIELNEARAAIKASA